MPYRYTLFLFFILSFISPFYVEAETEFQVDYYKRIVQSENKSSFERIDAYTKLLRIDSTEISNPISIDIVKLCLGIQDYSRTDSLLNLLEKMPQNNLFITCNIDYLRGRLALYQHDYTTSMDKTIEILKQFKPDSLKYFNAEAYILMSDLFNVMGNYKFGERCALRAQEIMKNMESSNKKSIDFRCLICLSNSLLMQGRLKEAFESLKKGRELANDSTDLQAIAGTLGTLYSMTGDFDMAESYYNDGLHNEVDPLNSGATVLNLAALKLKEEDYSGADSVLKLYKPYLENNLNLNMQRGLHQAKAYILFSQGNFEEAFKELDNSLVLADSAYISERNIYNRQMSTQFEDRLKEFENENKTENRVYLWIIFGICVFLICLVIYLVRKIKRSRQKERESYEEIVSNLKHRLSEIEKEAIADVDEKNQRLMSMAMHLARITESLDKINELSSSSEKDIDSSIKEIHAIVRQLSMEDNLWEMFKTYFEQVNQSFFNNLFKVQPNLTNAEVRMAAFILMNLTSKEIATLTNRSVRTVDSIKYNLRKKLGIAEPTEIYMRRLANSKPGIDVLENRNNISHI